MRALLAFLRLSPVSDLQQFGPDQFLLFDFVFARTSFPGQNIRHEKRITIACAKPSPP